MTEEEVLNFVINKIIENHGSLTRNLVESDSRLFFHVRVFCGTYLYVWIPPPDDTIKNTWRSRHRLINSTIEMCSYVESKGTVVISYKDILDYKTLMDM